MAVNNSRQSMASSSTYSPSSDSSETLPFGRLSSISSTSSIKSSSSRPLSPRSPTSYTTPRVQLIPHSRMMSFDTSLNHIEREIVDNTSFDACDISSKDFEFEDLFTYDKPQKKLSHVIEVTTPTPRERDWSNFSYSHYSPAVAARNKVHRHRSGISEMYVKNSRDSKRS